MSNIHLIIIKDDNIYFTTMHYRHAKALLEQGIDSIPLLNPEFLDAGYIILDLNKHSLTNAQNAFSLKHVVKKHSFLYGDGLLHSKRW